MKIREVQYSQLFTFGRYQNEEIGYTAALDEDENPDRVHGELRMKAVLQHHMNQQAREQGEEIRYIEMVDRDCSNELTRIQEKLLKLRGELSDLGAEVGALDGMENSIKHYESTLERLRAELREKLEDLGK